MTSSPYILVLIVRVHLALYLLIMISPMEQFNSSLPQGEETVALLVREDTLWIAHVHISFGRYCVLWLWKWNQPWEMKWWATKMWTFLLLSSQSVLSFKMTAINSFSSFTHSFGQTLQTWFLITPQCQSLSPFASTNQAFWSSRISWTHTSWGSMFRSWGCHGSMLWKFYIFC